MPSHHPAVAEKGCAQLCGTIRPAPTPTLLRHEMAHGRVVRRCGTSVPLSLTPGFRNFGFRRLMKNNSPFAEASIRIRRARACVVV